MAKKNRIPFRRETDSLASIDDDLDKAIANLDGANDRINALLQTMEPPKELVESPEGAVNLENLDQNPQSGSSSSA